MDFYKNIFDVHFDNRDSSIFYETPEGNYILKVKVPGFNKENLSVVLLENKIYIKGLRVLYNEEEEVVDKVYIIRDLIIDNAKIIDGVLTIEFKKPEEKSIKIELR